MELIPAVQKIIDEHGWEDLPNYPLASHHRDLERVAMRVQEFVAKRCAEIARGNRDFWGGSDATVEEAIRRHFGLEEE